MNREGVHERRSPVRWGQFVYATIVVALVAGGLYCGYLAYSTLKDLAAHTQFKSIPIFRAATPQPQQDAERSEQPAAHPDAPQKSVIVPDTEAKERVNILVMGIDQRPGESAACRTDTMMLVSVNPKDMSVSILSIPRDLWVEIPHPNHEKDRINTAHLYGETENWPGGGPALAIKTVEYNFGVRVHYFARLNFTGFERIIDYIGGIDIDVPVTIDDEKYPGENNEYKHLHIDAGWQHFDGEMALKYARTRRGTGDGDFTRMERQQQVILAIRDQVLSLQNLPQLIAQSPKLLREMGDSVETNLPVQEMLSMASWAQQIKSENIQTATISRDVTSDWWTPNGEMVLLYDRARARPIIDALFNDPTPEAEITQTSPVARLEAEGARVSVQNAGSSEGLGLKVESFLDMQGIDAAQVAAAAQQPQARTVVRLYADKPVTTEWLIGWLVDVGIPDPIVERPGGPGDADIVVILGADFPADKFD